MKKPFTKFTDAMIRRRMEITPCSISARAIKLLEVAMRTIAFDMTATSIESVLKGKKRRLTGYAYASSLKPSVRKALGGYVAMRSASKKLRKKVKDDEAKEEDVKQEVMAV
jgi:hypothetical protein